MPTRWRCRPGCGVIRSRTASKRSRAPSKAKGIGRNSFRKFDRLKTAEDRFVVTPNNLTIDGYALLDLADGPVVMHVPKLADDRWFIVQIGDAFDDVVLNVGGSRPHVPGAYLITGPDYQGRRPRRHDPGQLPHQHRLRRRAHRGQRRRRPARRPASPGGLHDQAATATTSETASRAQNVDYGADTRSPLSPHPRTWSTSTASGPR